MASDQGHVIVVGAGVFGLHAGLALIERGVEVTILEARSEIGAGASGGIVGALAPHAPDRWNTKKQFQLEALTALGPLMDRIEKETGLSTGYGRTGRITPLLTETMRERAQTRAKDAQAHWPHDVRLEVLEGDSWPRWLPPETAPFGLMHDTLSARLHPRQTVTALARAFEMRGGTLHFDSPVEEVCADGSVICGGTRRGADHVVLASGVTGFDLMKKFVGEVPGRGEKGQALLLDFDGRTLPVIQGDGLYIVPHADGTTGVGSTSERKFDAPDETDALLDALHAKAAAFSPRLARVPVLARWAGVRPRANGRDPMIGPLPGQNRVHAMLGGFKIGFGVAHKCAALVGDLIIGAEGADIPESFAVSAHLGFSPD